LKGAAGVVRNKFLTTPSAPVAVASRHFLDRRSHPSSGGGDYNANSAINPLGKVQPIFDYGRVGFSLLGRESNKPIRVLLASVQDKGPTDWSPDGRFLLYTTGDPKTGSDIWALPLDGDRKPFLVVQTNFNEREGQFSPDGKWIAYESNESGRYEIYVQPFPGPGGKVQVSASGGAQVRWRRDGKELFYIALDNRLMAVPIQLASNAQTIGTGAASSLFVTRVGGAVSFPFKQQYDVSPDGQRFLMNTVTDEAAAPITVILNWKPPKP
jgi:hypothetical protein